jgi:hypothetical protein
MSFGGGRGYGSDGLGFAVDFLWGERLMRTRRVRGFVGVAGRRVVRDMKKTGGEDVNNFDAESRKMVRVD